MPFLIPSAMKNAVMQMKTTVKTRGWMFDEMKDMKNAPSGRAFCDGLHNRTE